jgi:hypothetical protein
MFIKEKKLNNGLDGYIRISLSSNDEFLGHQQEIDNLTKFKSTDLVNPVVDVEKRKFKLDPTIPNTLIKFYFSGATSFINAGFTGDEISGSTKNIKNSFFILDFYDTYDPNTQIKIFKTYLTKLDYEPIYNVSSNTSNQLYYWYIPVSYIESNTGNTITGYVKFSFYNAKTGSIALFYNNDNNTLTTPEKFYFKATLNLKKRTWKFVNSNVTAIEQRYTGLINYNKRIDDTFNKLTLQKQVFPTGNTYNYKTNRYLDFK